VPDQHGLYAAGAGTLTGVTTVYDNAANTPQTITLLGTATGTPPA